MSTFYLFLSGSSGRCCLQTNELVVTETGLNAVQRSNVLPAICTEAKAFMTAFEAIISFRFLKLVTFCYIKDTASMSISQKTNWYFRFHETNDLK